MVIEEDNILDFDKEENFFEIEEKAFDPKQIRITMQQMTIDSIIRRIDSEEIDMFTEFQRKGNLWSLPDQSRLIESILLRFPLPAFYFDASDDEKWLIVDGLQRLWSLKNFILEGNNPLKLHGLEILVEYGGRTYKELPREIQRRIIETQLTLFLIQPGTPKEVKYNIFKRINTGGLILNTQEIRHTLYQGPASNFLRNIAEDSQFYNYVRVSDKRMQAREVILHYVAFALSTSHNYQMPMSDFLNRAMDKLNNKSDAELNKIGFCLFNALTLSFRLFGENSFRRSFESSRPHERFNVALFEVWTSLLSKLSQQESETILNNKEKLLVEYKSLFQNGAFNASISSSTSNRSAVLTRFEMIKNLIKKYSQ